MNFNFKNFGDGGRVVGTEKSHMCVFEELHLRPELPVQHLHEVCL